MAKLKQYEDRNKRPKYDGKTVKRFVNHALFDIHANDKQSSSSTKQVFEQVWTLKENFLKIPEKL
jgi:phosphopantetheinyl transferase